MNNFCENCNCASCVLVRTKRQQELDRINRLKLERLRRKMAIENARADAADLSRRMDAMIWLLVNTARNANTANEIIALIARALELRLGQVNTRRARYAMVLTRRSRPLRKLSESGERWAALPGSAGTELPDYCPRCGGMKTEGRKCRRKRCR